MNEVMNAFLYFYYMDKANAQIHLANVKFSPITFRLAEILESDGDISTGATREVMSHKGQYEEDKGR